MIFLQFIWILATAILALPVAILGFLHYLFYVQHVPCVNLQYYGEYWLPQLYCNYKAMIGDEVWGIQYSSFMMNILQNSPEKRHIPRPCWLFCKFNVSYVLPL